MKLDNIAIVLRRRSNWEALDLGARMVQSWARPVYRAWLSVYVPAAAMLLFAVGYGLGAPDWTLLLLWWLKPLFDRVLLHVLAHAVFGETKDWRALWAAMPSLIWRSGLLRALTWARLAPARSFTQAVEQLEGLRGRPARERRALLKRQAGGTAAWLTFTVLHFELILLLALLGLVWLMLPAEMTQHAGFWTALFTHADDMQYVADMVLALVYCGIVAFLEPFYVAGGFALYLKRRTDLEAWDVELALRRLQPQGARAAGALTALLLLVPLAGSLLVAPGGAAAGPAPAAADPALEARAAIAEVTRRPEFGTERRLWRLRYVGPETADDADATLKRALEAIRKALELIGGIVAQVSRAGMWVALGLLALALGWLSLRTWRLSCADGARRAPAPPAEVAGFDIRPESLPQDVAAAARALLRAGETRAGLSLLYRATLSALAHRERVAFGRGDTEGDCLRRVRTAAAQYGRFFEQLTRAWQAVAYARQDPSLQYLEELCRQWPRHFATSP